MVNLEDYGYLLPSVNLALKPSDPRDSSKLFIYDTKTDKITFDYFFNLNKYLPSNSFLVLNNTKVLPARVVMKKETGGKVVILFLVNEQSDTQIIKGMVDRKINIGDKLLFKDGNYIKAISQKENIFEFKFSFSKDKLFSILNMYGNMPIPPYLKKSPLTRNELMKKYQTIFAGSTPTRCGLASAAAPTASLHFTSNVFKKLVEKGIKKYFVTLHVGLGTFAPITNKNIKQKKLHEEYFEIYKKTLQLIEVSKEEGKKLVAVGTTVTRTLESLGVKGSGSLYGEEETSILTNKLLSTTNLFIFPPYNFQMVDILITNFHLPKSSLMMLVEAFLRHKNAKRHLVDLYNIAIKNDFRFYSFGDVMVIL